MNKYVYTLHRAIYWKDKFIWNKSRQVVIYDKSEKLARIKAELHCCAAEEGMQSVALGEEYIYKTVELGEVQHSCSILFEGEQGEMIQIVNTLESPDRVVSWLARILKEEGGDRTAITVKVEPIEITVDT